MIVRTLAHCAWRCCFHIVFCPKYRKALFFEPFASFIDKNIRLYCSVSGCYIESLSVQPDHLHLVVEIPPKLSVSEVVRKLKYQTNRLAQFHYPKLLAENNVETTLWSSGYFVSTIGIDTETVNHYVNNQ